MMAANFDRLPLIPKCTLAGVSIAGIGIGFHPPVCAILRLRLEGAGLCCCYARALSTVHNLAWMLSCVLELSIVQLSLPVNWYSS